MADNCSKLMKEALDNYLGIDMRYKLDDTLAALGKQKLNATQLEGYLLKQGVSPKEIKQSGILENFRGDNRALSGEDWLGMSGKQRVNTFRVAPENTQFDHITLDKKGEGDASNYREILSTVKKPENNAPVTIHFRDEIYRHRESLLGWRRTHVDEINGKKTLVLNEFQSDWAQTERAGRGTFESSPKPAMTKEKAEEIFADYYKSFFENIQKTESDKGLSFEQFQDNYWDDWVYYRTVSGPAELIEADKILAANLANIVADFPMSEIKHHQFQIVGAIDDALKQGIDTIAIPIQRENELYGSAGVTKFYESLNKKVLPDIRKKLEKQGMRIKVSTKDYTKTSKFEEESYRIQNEIDDIDWGDPDAPDIEAALLERLDNLATSSNRLYILEIEEIPNKKVNWDVYGLIGALGLSQYAKEGEGNASRNIE